MEQSAGKQYLIGFWYRFGAGFFDLIILTVATSPLFMILVFKESPQLINTVIGNVCMMVYLTFFWIRRAATPGNWLFSHRVVDYRTGQNLSIKQSVIRFLASWLSGLALFLGFLWVLWDKEKRSWHDKMAGTVVLSDSSYAPDASDQSFTTG